MSVDNAAGKSPNLQLPDVLVPLLRENTVGAVFVRWPLPGLVHAFNVASMKQVGALLLNKIT